MDPPASDSSVNNETLLYDFVITAGLMERITNTALTTSCTRAMIDSGANVNVGPIALAKALHLELIPHADTRASAQPRQTAP